MNILDSFVVEFVLDTAKWRKSRKEMEEEFERLKQASIQAGGTIEHRFTTSAEGIRKLRNQVISLFAVFTAGRGLREFMSDLVTTNAETGRTAVTLDETTESLSAWRNMAKITGGSAEGLTGSFQSLVGSLEQFYITGQSDAIPYLRALQGSLGHTVDVGHGMTNTMLDIAEAFEKMPDKAMAAQIGRGLGFDQTTINLLMLGRDALTKMLEEQKKLGVITKADSDAAKDLQASFAKLEQASTSAGRSLMRELAPGLKTVLDYLTGLSEWMAKPENKTVLEVTFNLITAAVVALSVALAGLAGPWVALFALVAAGALAIYEDWGNISKWWKDNWKGMSDDVKSWGDTLKAVWADVGSIWERIFGSSKTPQVAKPPGVTRTTPARPSAAYPEKQSDIFKLQQMGWTYEQAIGIVANIQRESGGKEHQKQIGGGPGYGLIQWEPPRQAEFAKWAGHDIQSSTRDEQLAFINYELRNTLSKAGKALDEATTATRASEVITRMYAKPKNVDRDTALSASIAAALRQASPLILEASKTIAPSQVTNNYQNSNETTIGTVVVNTQAKDAEGIAQDLGNAIRRNTLAEQANSGMN